MGIYTIYIYMYELPMTDVQDFTLDLVPVVNYVLLFGLFRVDFFIPEVKTVGGYSMCSGPELLEEKSLLELAVKYSTHPPAYWVHTKVSHNSIYLTSILNV